MWKRVPRVMLSLASHPFVISNPRSTISLLYTTIMQPLDHIANAYLAISLSPSSLYYHNPSALSIAHPSIAYVGQVGQMTDTQLFSIPRQEWDQAQRDILGSLTAQEGVTRVDVQSLQQRAKRGGDEL